MKCTPSRARSLEPRRRSHMRIGRGDANPVASAPLNQGCAVSAPSARSLLIPTSLRFFIQSPSLLTAATQALPCESTKRFPNQCHFPISGCRPSCCVLLAEKGYDTPTPIQSRPFPPFSPAATCSPAPRPAPARPPAFVLPILQKLDRCGTARAPRALVLTPTRELAAQVAESVRTYGKYAEPAHLRRVRRREHQSADRARCAAAAICSWRRPGACSISPSSTQWTCATSRFSCSTRPIACSTWASSAR